MSMAISIRSESDGGRLGCRVFIVLDTKLGPATHIIVHSRRGRGAREELGANMKPLIVSKVAFWVDDLHSPSIMNTPSYVVCNRNHMVL